MSHLTVGPALFLEPQHTINRKDYPYRYPGIVLWSELRLGSWVGLEETESSNGQLALVLYVDGGKLVSVSFSHLIDPEVRDVLVSRLVDLLSSYMKESGAS